MQRGPIITALVKLKVLLYNGSHVAAVEKSLLHDILRVPTRLPLFLGNATCRCNTWEVESLCTSVRALGLVTTSVGKSLSGI